MILPIIILVIGISLITNLFKKKYTKYFIWFSVLTVLLSYFSLSLFLFYTDNLFPMKTNYIYIPCGNFYNELTSSLLEYKLNILDNVDISEICQLNDIETIKKFPFLMDTSIYNDKIYIYFGITPVLLFYLPFHLLTNLYLTDKFLVFFLSCFTFLLSLFLIYKETKDYKNIPSNIKVLSVFFIGFCNLLPFFIVRSFIYQVAVLTANILLLGSFCLFYYFTNNKKNLFIFFISVFLCLAVGARPHYILFIPIFFFFIIYLKYNENKNIRNVFKPIFIFLIPCFIYGTILALYNYVRFDSVFEFGWKYQLNFHNQTDFIITIKDFIIGLKNNFLLLPSANEHTFFSLTKATGHRIGNEYITGVLWNCPIIFILVFIPNFLKKVYKEDKNNFIFLLIFISITIISIIVASFFGMIIRYIFEFLSLMIIISIIMFLFYINGTKDKTLKNFLNFLFILTFVFSIFINVSLLFCKENFWNFQSLSNINYTKVVKFLF